MKLIVDLIYEGGLSYMRYSVSDTAEYGDYYAGPQIVDDHTRATMNSLLAKIQDGTFAKHWIAENEAGRQNFLEMRKEHAGTTIETVGKGLRAMMPWLKKGRPTAQTTASGQNGD